MGGGGFNMHPMPHMPQPLVARGEINHNGDFKVSADHTWKSDNGKTRLTVEGSIEGKNGKVNNKNAKVSFEHKF